MNNILLIDDDVALCELVAEYLTQHGYRLDWVANGRQGLAKALAGAYDLLILDGMLPALDGLEVLAQLRRRSTVPVIMLTARTTPEDRIAGLETGADDYLPKPFNSGELLARIRAVLRRAAAAAAGPRRPVEVGGLRIDAATRDVRRDGVAIALTSVEFDILDLLVRSAGRVVSRDEIATVLYQRAASPYERSVDVHVSHLRKKLGGGGHGMIRTVRGVGYLFSAE